MCAEGVIDFTIEADSTLTGTWTIKAAEGFSENEIGPQVGSGKLSGSIKNHQFYVNLNPGWSDNNVTLTAHFSDIIGGGWYWNTFEGPKSSGGFTLFR